MIAGIICCTKTKQKKTGSGNVPFSVVTTGSIKAAVITLPCSQVANMGIIKREVQVAVVLLQCFCCRVPQRRAHQETEEPHNDYRLLLQGSVVIAYPETKVQEVMYEEF